MRRGSFDEPPGRALAAGRQRRQAKAVSRTLFGPTKYAGVGLGAAGIRQSWKYFDNGWKVSDL